jgi:hypothetical protein
MSLNFIVISMCEESERERHCSEAVALSLLPLFWERPPAGDSRKMLGRVYMLRPKHRFVIGTCTQRISAPELACAMTAAKKNPQRR